MSVVPNVITDTLEFLGHQLGHHGAGCAHRAPIIAELGINHNGSEELAHKMVDAAKICGADIVKLQIRDLKTTYRREYIENPDIAPGGLANYLPVLKACALSGDAYERLKKHAEDLKLGFLVTPFDIPSVQYLESLGVQAYKVASGDCTNPLLLGRIARTNKPFLVSTGMTKEDDILVIAKHLSMVAPRRYAFMHAVSGYPAPFRDCQLHMIHRLKKATGVPVGWSGHERGVAVSVGAVAVGADILERHFTLDRTMRGPDHAASLEPDGLKKLVERVRAFEEAYGDAYMPPKGINRGEEASHEVLGKSLVAKEDIDKDQTFGWHQLEARGPGRGLSPMAVIGIHTWRAKRDIKAGEMLMQSDLTGAAQAVAA